MQLTFNSVIHQILHIFLFSPVYFSIFRQFDPNFQNAQQPYFMIYCVVSAFAQANKVLCKVTAEPSVSLPPPVLECFSLFLGSTLPAPRSPPSHVSCVFLFVLLSAVCQHGALHQCQPVRAVCAHPDRESPEEGLPAGSQLHRGSAPHGGRERETGTGRRGTAESHRLI